MPSRRTNSSYFYVVETILVHVLDIIAGSAGLQKPLDYNKCAAYAYYYLVIPFV